MDLSIFEMMQKFARKELREVQPISNELNKVRSLMKGNVPLNSLVKLELKRSSSCEQEHMQSESEEPAGPNLEDYRQAVMEHEYFEESLSVVDELNITQMKARQSSLCEESNELMQDVEMEPLKDENTNVIPANFIG